MDLIQQIANHTRKIVEKTPRDRTVRATIAGIVRDNIYTVKMEGASYSAASISLETFHTGDSVYVLIPQNNYKHLTILGSTNPNKTLSVDVDVSSSDNNMYTQPEEPKDAPIGSLWIDTDENSEEAIMPDVYDYIGAHMANENMLLNWDFRRPVNQRGVNEWSNGYGLDMWRAGSSGNSWGSGVLMLRNVWLTQFFETFVTNGEEHTISICSGGVIDSVTLTPLANSDVHAYLFNGSVQVGLENDESGLKKFVMRATGGDVGITAVKLEIGRASTLAKSAPMNYGVEFLKCQRYLQALSGSSHWYRMSRYDSNDLWFMIPLSRPMRTTPTVSGVTKAIYNMNNTKQDDFTWTYNYGKQESVMRVTCTKSAHGLTDANIVFYGGFLSAEL